MLRFVVLAHDWPKPHLDLLLERDGILKAWQLPTEFNPQSATLARANTDHRLFYLTHEGPVSGDRGTVSRWDVGEVTWDRFEPDRVTVRLDGTRLRGRYKLIRRSDEEWEWCPVG